MLSLTFRRKCAIVDFVVWLVMCFGGLLLIGLGVNVTSSDLRLVYGWLLTFGSGLFYFRNPTYWFAVRVKNHVLVSEVKAFIRRCLR